jgi:hypothetical protein
MLLKIFAPFSGWRIIPEHEYGRVHGFTVHVDDETAARWRSVLDAYDLIQREMQTAAEHAIPPMQKTLSERHN